MNTYTCDRCLTEITWGVYKTSNNRYQRPLCYQCQELEIEETYPEKLKEFALKQLQEYTASA